MIKVFLSSIILLFSIKAFSEPPYGITQLNVTAVTGGINLNVVTYWGSIVEYVNYSYTINDNEIDVQVCYSPTPFPMEDTISNDLFIEISQANNYTIYVTASTSSSSEICADLTYYDASSTNFLAAEEYDFRNNEIVLFPNPAQDLIIIKSDYFKIENIEIYDHFGRLIKVSNGQTIDISPFNDGIYFVKFEIEKEVFHKRFIVKK